MKIDLSKQSHVLFFVLFLPAVSFGIGWAFSHVFPSWPFWIEGLSPLGAYAILYSFFERVAWKWPLFRVLGVVSVPNLNGRWQGKQLSSYKDSKGRPVQSYTVLEIKQTFSSVTAITYYHRWSNTHTASCFLDIDGKLFLVIIFESEPGVHHSGNDTASKGVARLCYLPSEKIITGTYFNTKGNQGEIKLRRAGKKLFHRFAA